jgi:hypothetical protein
MKKLHRLDLYGWSVFDEARDIDFHSVLWVRGGDNVLFDPLPLSDHDAEHLDRLGGAALIVITNSDHVRAAAAIAERTGARMAGPRAERESFPVKCDLWLGDGDEPVPGLTVFELEGSKTPGELALVIDDTTLLTGDLVRSHDAGRLTLLPEQKLADPGRARDSVRRLSRQGPFDAVLVGDGWPVFRDGSGVLGELVAALGT